MEARSDGDRAVRVGRPAAALEKSCVGEPTAESLNLSVIEFEERPSHPPVVQDTRQLESSLGSGRAVARNGHHDIESGLQS